MRIRYRESPLSRKSDEAQHNQGNIWTKLNDISIHTLIEAMVVIVDIVDNIWDSKAKKPKFERQWKIFKVC
jgi:hypothetical protein